MTRLRRLLAAAGLAAAIVGGTTATASTAGAITVQPPAGLTCYRIDGETRYVTCEVSRYLGGPFAPPVALRLPTWMLCRPFGDSWIELWNRDIYWGCGHNPDLYGYDLVWAL